MPVDVAVSEPVDDIRVSGNADAGDPLPAVVADQIPASDAPDPEPDPASEAGKQLAKKKGSLQGRIDDLTREKHDSKREAEAAKAELAALRAELQSLKQPKAEPAVDPSKPKRDDFIAKIGTEYQTYEQAQDAYDDARDEWRATVSDKSQRERASKDAEAAAWRSAQDRITAFKADHPDYDEVVGKVMIPPGPGAEQLLAHLTFSEAGAALAYDLAKHQPDELSRLASLPPVLVVEALGEHKASLKLRAAAAPSGPVATTPAYKPATPPIKPVVGSPVTSDDEGDPDDLSEAAVNSHFKRENAKILKRRRG
jgi:hypothetical protein